MGAIIVVDTNRSVRATVSGIIDYRERTLIRTDVAATCRTNSINHVLVDYCESEIKMTTAEHYSYGASFSDAGFPDETWLGVILEDEVMRSTLALFSIAVAQYRGMQIEVFPNDRTADMALNAKLLASRCQSLVD